MSDLDKSIRRKQSDLDAIRKAWQDFGAQFDWTLKSWDADGALATFTIDNPNHPFLIDRTMLMSLQNAINKAYSQGAEDERRNQGNAVD